MKDMESLYDEYKQLKNEIESMNLDEVGVFRLRQYRLKFEKLHERNLELQSSSRKSDIDNEELRQVLNTGDNMWRELGETLKPVVDLINFKMTLGFEATTLKRDLLELKGKNLETVETLKSQLDKFKEMVSTIVDAKLRSVFDDKIRLDEETIQRLESLDAEYDKRISELTEKIKVIALGGKIEELDEIRRNTAGLTPEQAEEEEEKINNPIDQPTTSDHEDEPSITERNPIIGETPEITKKPVPELEETQDDPEETSETIKKPIPELEEDPEETTETIKKPIPELEEGPEETQDDPEETQDDPEETQDDPEEIQDDPEETPVRANVKQPKTTLWQKIHKVLEAAKVFLLTAIAVHTGISIGGIKSGNVDTNTDTETIEETDIDISDEEEPIITSDEDEPIITPDENEPTITPDNEKQPEDEKSNKEVSTTDDVILSPGESVYDSSTKVEVGYSGDAVLETTDGYSAQEDRNLKTGSGETVIVTDEDLKPDSTQSPSSKTEETHTSEDEARKNMTDEEENNLDNAIDKVDWDAFFNGPVL